MNKKLFGTIIFLGIINMLRDENLKIFYFSIEIFLLILVIINKKELSFNFIKNNVNIWNSILITYIYSSVLIIFSYISEYWLNSSLEIILYKVGQFLTAGFYIPYYIIIGLTQTIKNYENILYVNFREFLWFLNTLLIIYVLRNLILYIKNEKLRKKNAK